MSYKERVTRATERFDAADVFVTLLGLVAAGAAVRYAYQGTLGTADVDSPLVAAGLLAVISAMLFRAAWSLVAPEYDDTCAVCGDSITVDSASDGFDSALVIRSADSPDRWTLGPISMISHRDRDEEIVCSSECADMWLSEFRHYKDLLSGRQEIPVHGAEDDKSDTPTASEVSD